MQELGQCSVWVFLQCFLRNPIPVIRASTMPSKHVLPQCWRILREFLLDLFKIFRFNPHGRLLVHKHNWPSLLLLFLTVYANMRQYGHVRGVPISSIPLPVDNPHNAHKCRISNVVVYPEIPDGILWDLE